MTMKNRNSGALHRLARNRGLAVVVIAAVSLMACSSYRVTITQQTGEAGAGPAALRTQVVAPEGAVVGKDAKIVPPKFKEEERTISGEPKVEDPWGRVRLRFDIAAAGKVENVRLVETTNDEVTAAAKELIATWPIEPGTLDGKPAVFRNVEATLSFAGSTSDESSSDSDGKTALRVIGIILLVPIVVIFAAAAVLSGVKFNK